MSSGLVLVVAGSAFVAFMLAKLALPRVMLGRTPRGREARAAIAAANARARERDRAAPERAAALREAAEIALQQLGHPALAASYARRAERLDPSEVAVVSLLSVALWRRSRFRALERLLWRRLARTGPDAPTLQELEKLYRGPLKRPEIADGLRRMT